MSEQSALIGAIHALDDVQREHRFCRDAVAGGLVDGLPQGSEAQTGALRILDYLTKDTAEKRAAAHARLVEVTR